MGRTGVSPFPPHPWWPPLLPGSLQALRWAARITRVGGTASSSIPGVGGPASGPHHYRRIYAEDWLSSAEALRRMAA